MQKALPGLMAALAATGLAAPAQAASHVDFSGYYTSMYISEHNIGNAPKGGADNYLGH